MASKELIYNAATINDTLTRSVRKNFYVVPSTTTDLGKWRLIARFTVTYMYMGCNTTLLVSTSSSGGGAYGTVGLLHVKIKQQNRFPGLPSINISYTELGNFSIFSAEHFKAIVTQTSADSSNNNIGKSVVDLYVQMPYAYEAPVFTPIQDYYVSSATIEYLKNQPLVDIPENLFEISPYVSNVTTASFLLGGNPETIWKLKDTAQPVDIIQAYTGKTTTVDFDKFFTDLYNIAEYRKMGNYTKYAVSMPNVFIKFKGEQNASAAPCFITRANVGETGIGEVEIVFLYRGVLIYHKINRQAAGRVSIATGRTITQNAPLIIPRGITTLTEASTSAQVGEVFKNVWQSLSTSNHTAGMDSTPAPPVRYSDSIGATRCMISCDSFSINEGYRIRMKFMVDDYTIRDLTVDNISGVYSVYDLKDSYVGDNLFFEVPVNPALIFALSVSSTFAQVEAAFGNKFQSMYNAFVDNTTKRRNVVYRATNYATYPCDVVLSLYTANNMFCVNAIINGFIFHLIVNMTSKAVFQVKRVDIATL